jgi:hypothetical protein
VTGWESRMAQRAAQRSMAEPIEPVQACQIGDPDMPDGHRGHHKHVIGNGIVCSCGETFGIFSFVPDPRTWSDDSAERAALERETREWRESISCSICGERGLMAEQDWGSS